MASPDELELSASLSGIKGHHRRVSFSYYIHTYFDSGILMYVSESVQKCVFPGDCAGAFQNCRHKA